LTKHPHNLVFFINSGAKELPDAGMIVDKLMKRTEFKPDPRGSNALFTFFAQHFTHQFFKTDFQRGPGFQWGGHGVIALILYIILIIHILAEIFFLFDSPRVSSLYCTNRSSKPLVYFTVLLFI
jgi:prostaglandin-endoperoxide synthase 2